MTLNTKCHRKVEIPILIELLLFEVRRQKTRNGSCGLVEVTASFLENSGKDSLVLGIVNEFRPKNSEDFGKLVNRYTYN